MGLIHIILAVGVNAHLIISARKIHSESKICFFAIPCSYALFLIFNFFVILSSLLSIKFIETPAYSLVFLSKLKSSYCLMILLGIVIVVAVFLPGKVCYSHNGVSIWPAFWGVFSVIESLIMIIYLKWLIGELKTHSVNSRSKLSRSVLKELEDEERRRQEDMMKAPLDSHDVSLDSITTI